MPSVGTQDSTNKVSNSGRKLMESLGSSVLFYICVFLFVAPFGLQALIWIVIGEWVPFPLSAFIRVNTGLLGLQKIIDWFMSFHVSWWILFILMFTLLPIAASLDEHSKRKG